MFYLQCLSILCSLRSSVLVPLTRCGWAVLPNLVSLLARLAVLCPHDACAGLQVNFAAGCRAAGLPSG